MLFRSALNYTITGLNIETTRCANSHSPDIVADLLSFRDMSFNHVTRLEALDPLLPLSELRTKEASVGESFTSVQRSPVFWAESGQPSLFWLSTSQAPTFRPR